MKLSSFLPLFSSQPNEAQKFKTFMHTKPCSPSPPQTTGPIHYVAKCKKQNSTLCLRSNFKKENSYNLHAMLVSIISGGNDMYT